MLGFLLPFILIGFLGIILSNNLYIGALDYEARKKKAEEEAKRIEKEYKQEQISLEEAKKKLEGIQLSTGSKYTKIPTIAIAEKVAGTPELAEEITAKAIAEDRPQHYGSTAKQVQYYYDPKTKTKTYRADSAQAPKGAIPITVQQYETRKPLKVVERKVTEPVIFSKGGIYQARKSLSLKARRHFEAIAAAEQVGRRTQEVLFEKQRQAELAEHPSLLIQMQEQARDKEPESFISQFTGGTGEYREAPEPESFVDRLSERGRELYYKAQREKGIKRQLYAGGAVGIGFVSVAGEMVRHPLRTAKGMFTFSKSLVTQPFETGAAIKEELIVDPATFIGKTAGYYAFGKITTKGLQTGTRKLATMRRAELTSLKSTKIARVGEGSKFLSGLEPEARLKVGRKTYTVKGLGVDVSQDIGKGKYLDVGGIKYLIKEQTKKPTKTYKGVQTFTGVSKVGEADFTGLMQYRTVVKLGKKKYGYETGVTAYGGQPYMYDEFGGRYVYSQFMKRTKRGVTKDLTKTMRKDIMPIQKRIESSRPYGIGAGLTKKMAQIGRREYYQTVSGEVFGKRPIKVYEQYMRDIFKEITTPPKTKGRIPPDTSLGAAKLRITEKPPTVITETFQKSVKHMASQVYGEQAAKSVTPFGRGFTGFGTLRQYPTYDFETVYRTTPEMALKDLSALGRIQEPTKRPVSRIKREYTFDMLPKRQVRQERELGKVFDIDRVLGEKQVQRQLQRQVQQQKQIQKQAQMQKQMQRLLQKQKLITSRAPPPIVPPIPIFPPKTFLIPPLDSTRKFKEKKQPRKKDQFSIFPEYKPSLYGVQRYKWFGEFIPKEPKMVGLETRFVTKRMIKGFPEDVMGRMFKPRKKKKKR